MITKQEFSEIITTMKDKRKKWDNLCNAMEALAPGEYVNFWPEIDYETMILKLLNDMFNVDTSDYNVTPIDFFCTEMEFGENTSEEYLPGVDISTVDKLYDYLVDTWCKERK